MTMTPEQQTGAPVFRVIDAMDGPHFGQILRLRLLSGRTPALKEVKGGTFKGRSPSGEESTVTVQGLSMVNGKASQARFARTGRVDVIAMVEGEGPKVSIQWTLCGPT
jgi:hypothetical protein